MIKPGTYKGLCLEAAWCKTQSKGTDYIGAVFEVFDDNGASIGQHAAEIYWTPNTKERAVKALKAMGWGMKTDASGNLVGPFKTTDIGIKNDPYDGQDRTKIDWVGEPPFGASIRGKDKLTLDQSKMLQAEVLAAMGGAPQF